MKLLVTETTVPRTGSEPDLLPDDPLPLDEPLAAAELRADTAALRAESICRLMLSIRVWILFTLSANP
ncbi:hypothetical protein HMI46_27175 [Paenibacillus alvei]|uniref:Uncharacterized protein n=1 Tax=Paenibacillus alvei TaxID=44250 RepID=A0AAP7DLK7_PAEAL|nr:hypothetical protein [Paenibacillus alvei]